MIIIGYCGWLHTDNNEMVFHNNIGVVLYIIILLLFHSFLLFLLLGTGPNKWCVPHNNAHLLATRCQKFRLFDPKDGLNDTSIESYSFTIY